MYGVGSGIGNGIGIGKGNLLNPNPIKINRQVQNGIKQPEGALHGFQTGSISLAKFLSSYACMRL